jgi:4'-phosphopantetheinyl transferase EntD
VDELAGRIETELRSILPKEVVAHASYVSDNLPVFAEEKVAIAVSSAARKREFLTGRWLARRSLGALGCSAGAILIGRHREPLWPPGFVGAISHSDGVCVAIAGCQQDYRGIGIDLERMEKIDPDAHGRIASADEIRSAANHEDENVDAAMLCFSAKEAFYKAFFPLVRVWFDFRQAWINVDWKSRRF